MLVSKFAALAAAHTALLAPVYSMPNTALERAMNGASRSHSRYAWHCSLIGEVEVVDQRRDLRQIVLQADAQAARMGLGGEELVVVQLRRRGEREARPVGVAVDVVRIDRVALLADREIHAGAHHGAHAGRARVQPALAGPAVQGVAERSGGNCPASERQSSNEPALK